MTRLGQDRAGSSRLQEAGTQLRCPSWVACTPSLAQPSAAAQRAKLAAGWIPRQSSDSEQGQVDMPCICLNWHPLLACPFLIIFFPVVTLFTHEIITRDKSHPHSHPLVQYWQWKMVDTLLKSVAHTPLHVIFSKSIVSCRLLRLFSTEYFCFNYNQTLKYPTMAKMLRR